MEYLYSSPQINQINIWNSGSRNFTLTPVEIETFCFLSFIWGPTKWTPSYLLTMDINAFSQTPSLTWYWVCWWIWLRQASQFLVLHFYSLVWKYVCICLVVAWEFKRQIPVFNLIWQCAWLAAEPCTMRAETLWWTGIQAVNHALII